MSVKREVRYVTNRQETLKEGGERVGILDFRPQKLGSFGTFKITKWKVS